MSFFFLRSTSGPLLQIINNRKYCNSIHEMGFHPALCYLSNLKQKATEVKDHGKYNVYSNPNNK